MHVCVSTFALTLHYTHSAYYRIMIWRKILWRNRVYKTSKRTRTHTHTYANCQLKEPEIWRKKYKKNAHKPTNRFFGHYTKISAIEMKWIDMICIFFPLCTMNTRRRRGRKKTLWLKQMVFKTCLHFEIPKIVFISNQFKCNKIEMQLNINYNSSMPIYLHMR